MSRKLRFVPEGGALVEVTCRTTQSRYLLRPSPELNEIIVGVLARAQRYSPVRICAASFLSNHYHLLLQVDDAQQLARFMRYFNGNLAREVGRLVDWDGKVWGRRYTAILVSEEEQAQVERLRYLLAQGVKENLVAKVLEWPGVHSAGALLTGEPLHGHWFDRTQEGIAQRKGESVGPSEFGSDEVLELSPLPCWGCLSAEAYRRRIAELIDEIEQTATLERRAESRRPLGRRAILRLHPHHRPKKTEKRWAPAFHTATRTALRALRSAYRWFSVEYRAASARLRQGDRSASFPGGCFPPGLPFVDFASAPRAP